MATGAAGSALTPARADRRERAMKFWDTVGQFYPSTLRQQQVAAYTDLAKKYSHPIGQWMQQGDNRILRNTGKSGLTPLSPLDPNEMITDAIAAQRADRDEYETYQRRRLGGFTPAELKMIGALAPMIEGEMKGKFDNDIHPLFERRWWLDEKELPKHVGMIPLLGDYDGFWTGQNDVVWDVLEPCLKLATVMITSLNAYPWLDAIFKGPVTPCSNDPADQGKWIVNERLATVRSTDAESKDLHDKLKAAAGRIRFGFRNNYTHWNSGIEDGQTIQGITAANYLYAPGVELMLVISVEWIQPLLRTDLNDAERLLAQFYVAVIIVHEIGHCSWQLVRRQREVTDKRRYDYSSEPYFANEEYMELGFSFVDKILGGEPEPLHGERFHRGGPGLPILGIAKQDWFEHSHARNEDIKQRHIAQSSSAAPLSVTQPHYDFYPLPMSWVHNMFQSASWDVVYKKTGIIPNMGPLTIGTRIFPMLGSSPEWLVYITNETPSKISADLQLMGMDPAQAMAYDLVHLQHVGAIYAKLGMAPSDRNKLSVNKASLVATSGRRQADLTADRWDTLPDEEEIPPFVWSCPRYREIVTYLTANRGPLELALDTMDILPFPTFFRYIRERGGINLTAIELWNFLGLANRRKEFFIFSPYPGPGLVIRLEAGWTPSNPLAILNIPAPTYVPTPAQKDRLMEIVRRQDFREYVVRGMALGSMMDVGFESLRQVLIKTCSYRERIVPFKAIVTQCVRESWEFNSEFTLGPEGIIRFTMDMTAACDKILPQFVKNRLAAIQKAKSEIDDEWRRRQLAGI